MQIGLNWPGAAKPQLWAVSCRVQLSTSQSLKEILCYLISPWEIDAEFKFNSRWKHLLLFRVNMFWYSPIDWEADSSGGRNWRHSEPSLFILGAGVICFPLLWVMARGNKKSFRKWWWLKMICRYWYLSGKKKKLWGKDIIDCWDCYVLMKNSHLLY